MSATSWGLAASLLAMTVLGWLYFPGHTFLHSDTQIYLPILDRLWDPSLYPKDPVALRPHVSFTIYDELTLALRRVTSLSFENALYAQQLVWRAAGLIGVFLIARALQFPAMLSLLIASIYGLGGTIPGPAVLIVEYEPVPRGFAGALLMLAAGLAAHGRWQGAGVAFGVALLYHPPTTLPFAVVFPVMALWPRRGVNEPRKIPALIPVLITVAALAVLSRMQAGASESQEFFGTVDAELERLLRLRGSYNWISMWPPFAVPQHVLLWAACGLAWLRLRALGADWLRWYLLALPACALLTVPLQYLLLEEMKWALMPQLQPARAVTFIAAFTVIGAAAAGLSSAQRGRMPEGVAWLTLAFAIPAHRDLGELFLPRNAELAVRLLVVISLAAVAALAALWRTSRPRLSLATGALAMALPFWAMPGAAKVVNYPNLDEPELHQLGDWALANTPKDASFLFPEHGRQLQPGFFRVYAKRGLYVDWKSGGQVNLLREFAFEWRDRWNKVNPETFSPDETATYSGFGIDYIVVRAATALPGRQPVYRNARYAVYRLP